MCALFSKTHPPDFSIKEWELGISKSLSDLLTLRISKGFIIREHTEYRNHLISGCGYINAKKKFKGGFTIQLINSVHPKNNRCDIFFIGFNEDYVIQAMNNNFVYLGNNKWQIEDKQHFWLQKHGFENFELSCSDIEGKCYC